MAEWFKDNVAPDFTNLRAFIAEILQEEASLDEIVRLVGMDALSYKDRVTMETAKIIREDYLHQNAFHETDTYTSLLKQYKMLKLIRAYYDGANAAIDGYADLNDVLSIPAKDKIGRAKYVEEKNLSELDEALGLINKQLKGLIKESDNV